MPLIGTAGHVDHGKSTLIRALSGRDPDRWAEEKRRGLTIDLGFAWADLGDGNEVSFVDVPGHERYLKNMLAGVDALDVAILVIAANEGWMPQTEEHLAVLDLLEVPRGLVALTKTDLVEANEIELVSAAIEEKLAATTLAGSSIVPLSVPHGSGVEHLKAELLRLCREVDPPASDRARLWVDRSFTVAGTGTVVTGSLLGGNLATDDRVRIYPGDTTARIRSLQSHEKDVSNATPGRRVAVSLVGVDVSDIGRGDMLGFENHWRTTRRLATSIRTARYVDELPDKGAYQLHVGTATVNTRILKRDGDRALLSTSRPIPASFGDRFVLRDTGRRLVVAGGTVLDPAPVRGSMGTDLDPRSSTDAAASHLLQLRGIDTLVHIRNDSGGGTPDRAVVVDDLVISSARFNDIVVRCEEIVQSEHEERPMRPGTPLATLAGKIAAPHAVVEKAVRTSHLLEIRGPDVALTEHRATLDEQSELLWEQAREVLRRDLSVPPVADLGLTDDLVHLLIRRGDLVRVSETLVFLGDQIEQIVEAAAGLDYPFGVGEFKEALGLSRKYSVPLLEWLDNNEYTIRREDGRVPGPKLRSSA
jgi:selenocysteine-specific elongation factor